MIEPTKLELQEQLEFMSGSYSDLAQVPHSVAWLDAAAYRIAIESFDRRERVCATCKFYVEQTHKTPFGRISVANCTRGHIENPKPDDYCSRHAVAPHQTQEQR